MPYPGVYRAKAQRLDGNRLTANIPQVFGEAPVTITSFVGSPPTTSEMGWVAFHGGRPEFPVWLGVGTGGGGGGGGGTVTDTLWVGPDAPTDSSIEMWWDTDDVSQYASTADTWNSAWGIIAKLAPVAASASMTGAVVAITTPISVTFQTGRRYRVVAYVRAISIGAGAFSGELYLYDGTTSLIGLYGGAAHYDISITYGYVNVQWVIEGSGQVYPSFQVKGIGASGSVLHTSINSAFYVEDVGPVTRLPTGTPPPDDFDWTPYDARYVNVDEPAPAWTALPLSAPWGTNPYGFVQAAYRKVGDIVYLRGTTSTGATAPGETIGTLPDGYRPPGGGLIFSVWASYNSTASRTALRVNVLSTGVIQIQATYGYPGATATNIDHLSFDGILFSVTA